jgi:hypothetical protein
MEKETWDRIKFILWLIMTGIGIYAVILVFTGGW